MDEFVGTATELRGLFKIHTSTAVDSNLQQIICSTAKEWFEKSEGKLNLLDLISKMMSKSIFGLIVQKKRTEN